jgi:hypothetical protein
VNEEAAENEMREVTSALNWICARAFVKMFFFLSSLMFAAMLSNRWLSPALNMDWREC